MIWNESNIDCGIDPIDLNNILKIIRLNKKISSIILFGSRAKGNYKKGSDIDLAVTSNNVSLEELLDIKSSLNDLMLPCKIDLIDYNKISNKELKEHINRVGKTIG